MDRFNEMEVFVRVVEDGGFSAAADKLRVSPSAVSKLIARLEKRLGVRLFLRSSRHFELTAEGGAFYQAALSALAALEDAEARISALGQGDVSGTLRIRAVPSFARYQIAPLVPEFRARYPKLQLEFFLDNAHIGQLDSGVDLAIYSGVPPDSSAIVRTIAQSRWIVCAAPSYLKKHGVPKSPDALARFDCLNFTMSTSWNDWPFLTGKGRRKNAAIVPIQGAIAANQGDMLLALARAGAGIVRLAEYHVADELASGRLVPLLSEYQDPAPEPIYVLFHNRIHLARRVRVFIDFLSEKFQAASAPGWARVPKPARRAGGHRTGKGPAKRQT